MAESVPQDVENQSLFQQIKDYIRSRIETGDLAEHAALPSERMLAEMFEVSRMTARRALVSIEAEGLAYSSDRRGRFVSPRRLTYDIGNTLSFAASARERGMDLTIRVISSGTIKADARLAGLLGIKVDEALCAYTRLFLIDNHPAFIETEYLIASLVPGLLDLDLCQSSTELLERRYGIHSNAGHITIRMGSVKDPEAGLLGLSDHHGIIELEQVIADQTGRPFCFGHQIWRGELAEFSVIAAR